VRKEESKFFGSVNEVSEGMRGGGGGGNMTETATEVRRGRRKQGANGERGGEKNVLNWVGG